MKKLEFENYIRISKAEAMKRYELELPLYLAQNKANLDSPWIEPAKISKSDNLEFENALNAFSYYNSSRGLGTRINFYKPKNENDYYFLHFSYNDGSNPYISFGGLNEVYKEYIFQKKRNAEFLKSVTIIHD